MQGDSVLVRDSESSSYPVFELSRFNCISNILTSILCFNECTKLLLLLVIIRSFVLGFNDLYVKTFYYY